MEDPIIVLVYIYYCFTYAIFFSVKFYQNGIILAKEPLVWYTTMLFYGIVQDR